MQELQTRITEVLASTIASGALDEMIKAKLTKTIDDVLDNLLHSWSPLGKAIEKELQRSLAVDLDLGLGGYNELVAGIVKQRVDQAIAGEWKVKLEAQLDEMLRGMPSTIKITEMLENLAADHQYHAQDKGWESATLIVDLDTAGYGSRWVYLDAQPRDEEDKYQCTWKLLVDKDGSMVSAIERGVPELKKQRDLFESRYGFEGLLFKLKAAGTRIEMDVGPGVHEHPYEASE